MAKIQGWKTECLGEVIEAKYGKALPQGIRQPGAIPVYGSNGVVGWHDAAITSGPTIIIGRKGSVGAINYSDVPCWPIDTTFYIDQPGPFQIEFLQYLLRSLGLTELDRSTAIPGLSRDQLYEIKVPIPSDYDQNSLVNLLERADTHRALATKHLQSARRALERFRQAVLAAACSGRLTATWRETRGLDRTQAEILLEHATEERRRVLGRKFRYFEPEVPSAQFTDSPPEWARTTIGNIATLITKGSSPSWQGYSYQDSGVLFVRSQNIRWGHVDLNEVAYLSPDFNATHATSIVHEKDVLLNLVGASVGRAATAPVELTGANLNQAVSIIRPARGVSSDFITLYLLSPFGQQHIHSQKADVARANFNLDDIKVTPIPLPTTAEQEEIARVVRELFSFADGVRKLVDSSSKLTAASSQAVLAKAFRRELTPIGTPHEAAEAKS